MTTIRYLLLVFCFGSPVIAEYAFSGYAKVAGVTHFVVTDVDNRITSSWLSEGDSFREITIQNYDVESQILSVIWKGKILGLPLKENSVVNGTSSSASRNGHGVEMVVNAEGNVTVGKSAMPVTAVPVMFRTLASTKASGTITIKRVKAKTQSENNQIEASIRSIQNAKLDAGLFGFEIHIIVDPVLSDRDR